MILVKRTFMIVAALALSACPDDDAPPSNRTGPDANVPVDASTSRDAGVSSDASIGEEDAGEPMGCSSVPCDDGGVCYACPEHSSIGRPEGTNVYPDGLDPNVTIHFRFDSSSPDTAMPVEHSAPDAIVSRASSAGVELLLSSAGGASSIAGPDWYFMPHAVRAPDGVYLVCWVHFTGSPSAATAGGMPDPRTGSRLVCRTSADGVQWSSELVVPSATTTAWIIDTRWDAGGATFVVSVYEDPHGTFFNDWDTTGLRSYPIADGVVGEGYADPSITLY